MMSGASPALRAVWPGAAEVESYGAIGRYRLIGSETLALHIILSGRILERLLCRFTSRVFEVLHEASQPILVVCGGHHQSCHGLGAECH